MVSESIGSYKIIFRRNRSFLFDDCIEFCIIRISEEYRFDVGIIDTHMFHTVFLFISPSKFVLFNCSRHIVFDACTYDQSILSMSVHGLSVDVIMFFVILYQPTFLLEHIKVLYRFLINFWTMFVRTGNEIDLRFNNMVERLFITIGFLARFF